MKSEIIKTIETSAFRFDLLSDGKINISWGENYTEGIGLSKREVEAIQSLLRVWKDE